MVMLRKYLWISIRNSCAGIPALHLRQLVAVCFFAALVSMPTLSQAQVLADPAPVPSTGQLPTRDTCSYALHLNHSGIDLNDGAALERATRDTLALVREAALGDEALPLAAAKLGAAPWKSRQQYSYGLELLFYRDCNKRTEMGHHIAQLVRDAHSLPTQVDEIPGPLPMKDWKTTNCDIRYWNCSE